MNKKGFIVQDLIFMAVIILVFAIVAIIGSMLFTTLSSRYNDTLVYGHNSSSFGKNMTQEMSTRYPKIFDNVFLIVVVLLALSLFVTMFLINSHPALFFIIIILLAFGLIAIAAIGNVFIQFSESSEISGYASQFTYMSFIYNNWITILLGIGFVGIIVFFAKIRTGMFE